MVKHNPKSSYKYSRIGIVGYFKYPFGSAGASRVRNISKGLMLEGASVNVITQSRYESDAIESSSPHNFEGIPYHTTYKATRVSSFSTIGRTYSFFRSVFESAHLVQKLIVSKKIDAVVVYALGFFSAFPVLKVCKEFDIPVITDIVEWVTPDVFAWRIFDPQYMQIIMKRKLLDQKFDGAIVISSYLYEKYNRPGYPVIRIPALFDFESSKQNVIEKHTPISKTTPLRLSFVGGNKINDGLDDVIKAIRLGDFRDYVHLSVIGNAPSDGYIMQLRAQVDNDLGLKNAISFVGRLPLNDYFDQLKNSDVLLLTRKDNIMARAAFPNRLPEFLSTGKPVITTSVPDIPEYLVDGEHAFVVPPARPDLLAEKIGLLVKDRKLGSLIGNSGREQAMKCFDFRHHARRLLEFVNDLN